MPERLTSISELPVDAIEISGRLREVSEDGVATLIEAIEERGFLGRIQVRRTPKGDVVLDGAHRLTAMRRLGRETISCEVFKCSDAEARMIEIDGNLMGADLTLVDEAYFLAERRRTLHKLKPETRQGAAGAQARWDAVHSSALASIIADKRGIKKRQVYNILAAGDAVRPEELPLLRSAPQPVTIKDMLALGKITDDDERAHVVLAVAHGNEKSVADARRAWKGQFDVPDPAEVAARKLIDAWSRAPMVAKRRLVEAFADDLAELLAEWRDE